MSDEKPAGPRPADGVPPPPPRQPDPDLLGFLERANRSGPASEAAPGPPGPGGGPEDEQGR